jgi:hypothetical protein
MTLTIARQMLAAEILKLRRNRALLGFSLLLAVGTVALFFGYNAIQHASNPAQYGPAGGTDGFGRAVRALGLSFGALAAILIGTEAGTADKSSGVFRDLVATGRSRLALFSVRAPAAIVVTLTCTGLGFLVTLAATFLFAGSLPTPSLSLILESAAWIALCNAIIVSLAVGVGSITGSRALTLTAVIGFQTIVTELLLGVTSLGSVRDVLPTASLGNLMPVSGDVGGVTMTTGVALTILLGWVVIPAAVGAWRTQTQDA